VAKVGLHEDRRMRHSLDGGVVQKPVVLTTTNWHAQWAAGLGAAIAEANPATFTNPATTNCDRCPRVVAAAGGAAFVLTLTGTWNGAAQTEAVACPTNATTDFTRPFDTVTAAASDVDPLSNVDLQWGNVFAEPPARQLYVGTAGAVSMQLEHDTALQVVANVPIGDLRRHIRRIGVTGTAASNMYLVW